MNKYLLTVVLTLFLIPGFADKERTYGNLKVSAITSVYDGATFMCDIKDVKPIIGHRINVRVYGIKAPNMNSRRTHAKVLALKAKKFTEQLLKSGKVIELRNVRRDNESFSIVADVIVDGKSLGDKLVDAGLAKES